MHLVPQNSPVLHIPTPEFDFKKPSVDLTVVVPEMFALMEASGGVGLAAPQVGLAVNLFVMRYASRDYVCINSEFDTGEEKTNSLEGCLSFPSLRLTLKRFTTINAGWTDEHGKEHREVMEIDIGRIFQHEHDHVRGITFDTKISKLKLNMANRKMRKANQ